MKITHVTLDNFRCFEKLDLDFDKCQALIGENGSGKTAVLEAIHIVTSAGLPRLGEQDFNNNDRGDLSIRVTFDQPFLSRVPDGYTTQDIPCQSILLTAHRRERAAPGKALSDPLVVERYTVPLEYTTAPTVATSGTTVNVPTSVKKTTNGYESPRKGGSTFKFTPARLTLQNELIAFPNVFYFDRDREEQARVGYNSVLQRVAKDLNWRFRKEWDAAGVEQKWNEFYGSVISTVENPKGSRILQPLREKMMRIAQVDFSDLELSLLDIEQPFSRAFFARRTGTNQIEQKRFGSGISILLAYFLLDIISSLSKEEIVFLIDEPELHLHPQLQQALFAEFQGSSAQVIYTTQSDCFISIAEWRSISRFKHDFSVTPVAKSLAQIIEGNAISSHLDEIKKWHQHRSLFFREDNQILFARKCLLVEGPAEKYGLPVLAQKLNKSIVAVTILSCNGKNKIPYYQLLCKAFGIPVFTLFDLDGQPVTADENKRVQDWSDAAARFSFEGSFEKLLGVGNAAGHKASQVLTKIDSISVADVPVQIKEAIEAIGAWGNE